MKTQTLPGFSAAASLYRKFPAFGQPSVNQSTSTANLAGSVIPSYDGQDCYADCRRVGLLRKFCKKACGV